VLSGPGEQGQAVVLKPEDEHEKQELYKTNGFNALISDRISLNRSIPDIRHPGCKKVKHLANLPDVSVVVPFHNEHLSTLLRTAMSAIFRGPPGKVREVILVDDFSSKGKFIKRKNYIS
jgi:polypeptide N-acetylgalactosaminyltransferase